MRLGFLLNKHYSAESQSLELWHLINSKLEDEIPKDQVVTFLNDLLYVAIDMNLSKVLWFLLWYRYLEAL